MAKMFYTTDEAAQKLGVNNDQLKALISENKLREFRDGAKVMFKVDQVDKLLADRKTGTASGTRAGTGGPIGLADSSASATGIHDSHGSDVISLADSQISSPSKDDTVVTTGGGSKAGSKGGSASPGQQVFKPGEVKSAETGAQTTIQSAIDDQLSLEGVGSGSGLLDLTRESDDTSLGAELLDEIYPGGDTKAESGVGSASGIFEQTNAGGTAAPASTGSSSGLEHMVSSSAPAAVAEVEVRDPTSGMFGGLALGATVICALTIFIAMCFYNGFVPNWVGTITQSLTYVLIFGVGLAVVAVIFGVIGMVVGRSS